MTEEKNIAILRNEKSDTILIGILEKYKLQETDGVVLKKAISHELFNETIVIGLTRDLILEKISNKGFLDALHKELKTSKEVTKNIALDIINNLIPLLEKVPEDKLEEYNRKNRPKLKINKEDTEKSATEKKEAFARAKEELMKKIGVAPAGATPSDEAPMPYTKNPDIADVEENAKTIEHVQQKTESAPVIEKPTEKKVDPYKEPVD